LVRFFVTYGTPGALCPCLPKALTTTSIDAILCAYHGGVMRTTLALDDDLLAKAQAYTGLREKSSLVREALKALIERESARRLARLGGTESEIRVAPRRRPKAT